jgi:hypothetical protein
MNIHSKNLALTLLPHAALRLVGMTIDDNVLTLTVRSIAGGASCPVCETKTVRIRQPPPLPQRNPSVTNH